MISDPTAVVVPISDARRRCQQLHLLLESMTRQKEKVLTLVSEAKEQDDHLTLGYPSWPAYVSAEFARALSDLTRDDRRWAAVALAQTGMSSRAIAPIVGVTDRQVRADVRQVGSDFPPEDLQVNPGIAQVGHHVPPDAETFSTENELCNASHSSRDGGPPDWRSLPAVKALSDEKTTVSPTEKTTGLDGKRYARPEPRPRSKPKRRPLPAAWVDALYELEKDVDRLARLAADDRFPTHRADLARVEDLARISKKLWKARKALAGDAALPLGGAE